MKSKPVVWVVVGLLILGWGGVCVLSALSDLNQYSVCRQLPAITHGEIVIKCAPVLRTALMWGVLALAVLAVSVWALVRAFRMDRMRAAA